MTILAIIQGFFQIAFQLLGSKFVTTAAGSNLMTWALIVCVFLISMSFGQYLGATISKRAKRPERLVAMALILAGVWILGVTLGLHKLQAASLHMFEHSIANATMLITVIFSIPIVMTSTVMPVALKIALSPLRSGLENQDGAKAGFTMGHLASMNSLGSVAGALFVAFVTFGPLALGTSVSISLLIGLLSLGSHQIWTSHRLPTNATRVRGFAFFLIAVLFSQGLQQYFGTFGTKLMSPDFSARLDLKLLESKESFFSVPQVLESAQPIGHRRSLIFAFQKGIHCQIDFNGPDPIAPTNVHNNSPYLKYTFLAWGLPKEPKNILTLGLGGGCLSHFLNEEFALQPQNRPDLTYVEIDPSVASLARTYFFLPTRDRVIVDDARSFLSRNEEKYDLIVIDTFTAGRSVPEHLLTAEYFSLIRKSLAPGGAVLINHIPYQPLSSIQDGRSAAFNGLVSTLNASLPNFSARFFHIGDTDEMNLILFLSEQPTNPAVMAERLHPVEFASTEFKISANHIQKNLVFRDFENSPGWTFMSEMFHQARR